MWTPTAPTADGWFWCRPSWSLDVPLAAQLIDGYVALPGTDQVSSLSAGSCAGWLWWSEPLVAPAA